MRLQSLVTSVLSLALLTCATASSRAAQTAPIASTQEGALSSGPQPPGATGSAPTVLSAAQLARDAALAPRTEALLKAFTNGRPRLLSDGRVVFLSNRDGLPAIYVGDAAQPSASPRKLPGPDERIAGYEVLPDQKTVLFAADVKSDQLFAIFKVGLDGTGLANLTNLARQAPSFRAGKDSAGHLHLGFLSGY